MRHSRCQWGLQFRFTMMELGPDHLLTEGVTAAIAVLRELDGKRDSGWNLEEIPLNCPDRGGSIQADVSKRPSSSGNNAAVP